MEHDSGWMFLEYDPITMKSIYVRSVGDKIQVKETIPMWLAQRMLDENKRRANEFTGWAGKKNGGVVAAVPGFMDAHLKSLSGFDPTKGGEYDKDRYNSLLDDSDYRHLRTGGGKIGKRKAAGNGIQSRLKLGASPLAMVSP